MKIAFVATLSLAASVIIVPSASAQNVDACATFTPDLAQVVTGSPMSVKRNVPAKSNGSCDYQDATGMKVVGFQLWKMASPGEASKYMQSRMNRSASAVRTKPEAVAGLGDEAFYVDVAMVLFVRKGSTWFGFGYPNRQGQIDAARKILGKL